MERCPICGAECALLYLRENEIFACDRCVEVCDADEVPEEENCLERG